MNINENYRISRTEKNGKMTTDKEQENHQNDAESSKPDNNPIKYDEDYNINSAPRAESVTEYVNMEAIIRADDVVRAGGFGARDDIGSFLPVAADSTDFEASLLDAEGFEEPQGEKRRPGLGWTEAMEK